MVEIVLTKLSMIFYCSCQIWLSCHCNFSAKHKLKTSHFSFIPVERLLSNALSVACRDVINNIVSTEKCVAQHFHFMSRTWRVLSCHHCHFCRTMRFDRVNVSMKIVLTYLSG